MPTRHLPSPARSIFVSLLFAAALAGGCTETSMNTGYLFDHASVAGVDRRFAVYVPPDYSRRTKWPVVIFLNGAGECGTDGQRQLAVGLAPAIMLDPGPWRFIAVFPQKPDRESTWLDHDELVMTALRQTQDHYSVDPDRIYLTGLSQGGRGTWEIAARHHDIFAAIAPLCGWSEDPTIVTSLKTIPIWAFHGEQDTAVPAKGTKDLVASLVALGASPKMTIYPDANHNCWDQAYRREHLAEWFLTHARGVGLALHSTPVTPGP